MSDDLVKRLDNLWEMLEEEGFYTKANTAMLARNRIEELEAERDEALNQLDSARHSIDVLERRVAELKGEKDE